MNIIFFLSGLDSGGIENYLLRFLKIYHHKFNKIYVWCKAARGGPLEKEYLAIPNVEIIKFSFGYFNPLKYNKLKEFIKANDIGATCDFTGSFAGFTMLTSKIAGVENRVVFYRNSRDKFKPTFLRKSYRKLIQTFTKTYSTKILSNSYAALDYFYPNRDKDDLKFKVIYNGIDAKKFKVNIDKEKLLDELGIPKNTFLIGHVGRFNSQKNHITILNVMNSLATKYDNIYCILCGKGTKEEIPSIINEINPALEEKVKILGNRNDVNKLLKILDVFFFPSTIEGQPNALIEAMISGVPFVSSNIEPIKETTPTRFHSYLKDPEDVQGFSELIEKIYESEEFRSKLLCVDWAETRFDYKVRFDEFYKEL